MESTIVNKVAESGIVTLDLAPYIPAPESVVGFDLKPFLFMEMILREKDFRAALTTHDWSAYAGKHVAMHCSADAVIPVWAYMLVASALEPVAASVYFGTGGEVMNHLVARSVESIPAGEFADKRVVLKGCGDTPIPEQAYLLATLRLKPHARSIMYGEPCSTVPVWKKK